MSIKGNGEELFVGKKASNIFTADGKRTAIPYQSLKKIEYCLATPEQNGKLKFIKINLNTFPLFFLKRKTIKYREP